MGLDQFDGVLSFAGIMLLLSLQLTVLVQAVSAALGLRGRNLRRGVEELFRLMEVKEAGLANKLATAVLRHPSVAHTSMGQTRYLATAIRPQEVLRILEDLERNPPEGLSCTVKQAITAVLGQTAAGETPQLASKAAEVTQQLSQLFPEQATAIHTAVQNVFATRRRLELAIQNWFDTLMDRTTERFVLWTRWITAVLGFAMAFGLQVDSIYIFRQLQSSSALRASVIQTVDAALPEAERIVAEQRNPPALATLALQSVATELKDSAEGQALAADIPDRLVTRQSGTSFIHSTFSAEESRLKVLGAFDKAFTNQTMKRLAQLGESFDRLAIQTEQTHFSPFFHGHSNPWWWLGMLLTGVFLSLGAPFWYNTFRQLASLRPGISGKVEKEKEKAEQGEQ